LLLEEGAPDEAIAYCKPMNGNLLIQSLIANINGTSLALPNRYRRVMLDVIAFDVRSVGAALVDGDGRGKRIVPDGTGEKAQSATAATPMIT
jgi:hypothetical protein